MTSRRELRESAQPLTRRELRERSAEAVHTADGPAVLKDAPVLPALRPLAEIERAAAAAAAAEDARLAAAEARRREGRAVPGPAAGLDDEPAPFVPDVDLGAALPSQRVAQRGGPAPLAAGSAQPAMPESWNSAPALAAPVPAAPATAAPAQAAPAATAPAPAAAVRAAPAPVSVVAPQPAAAAAWDPKQPPWTAPAGRSDMLVRPPSPWQAALGAWIGVASIMVWALGPVAVGLGTWSLVQARREGHGLGRPWTALIGGGVGTLLGAIFLAVGL